MHSLTGISTRDLLTIATLTAFGVGSVVSLAAYEVRKILRKPPPDVWYDRPTLTEDRVEQVNETHWPTCEIFNHPKIPDSVWLPK